MARNVGSIEVTVDANTSRLRAKLVKDATSAGKEAANALERELRDIDAELSLNSTAARADLRKFKEAAERLDIELELGLSEASKAELKAQLAAIDEQIDDLDAQVGIELTPGAKAQLEAQLKELEKTAEQFAEIKLQASLTGQASLNAALKQIESEIHKIEFRLDADPTEIQAKIAKLAAQKEDIEFQLRIDEKSRAIMEAQLERIEVENRTIEMRAILDEKQALAQLQALQDVQVDLGLDVDRATALYESWRERLEAQKIEARITGDFTDFNLSIRELKAKLALEEFEAKVDANIRDAMDSIVFLQEAIETNDLEIPVDADLSKAREAIAFFRTAQARNDIEIPVDIDVDALDGMLARMEAASAAGGDSAGEKFAKAFGGKGLKIIPGMITEWIPLVSLALEPLIPLVEGIAGGAVQVISSAFSALGGAGGALLPIVAGIGATFGAVAIASMGMGDAVKASATAFTELQETGTVSDATLKKVDTAMRKLTPAARDFVSALAELFPQLRNIQEAVSEQVFAGLADELRALSSETIPDIGQAFVQAGGVANRFFRELSSAVQEIDFAQTFAMIEPALDSLGRAIANVVRSIQPFLQAAAPAARELAKWIEEGSQAFLAMTRSGAQSGAITRFLLEGIDSLKEWARLIEATGRALFTLFQAGKSGGDGLVSSLTTIINKWNDWMKSTEGSEALTAFFETSRKLLADMVPLIKGVADGLGAMFTGAAEGSFKNLAAALGDILRVAGELIGALNQANVTGAIVQAVAVLARAIEQAMPAIERFMSAFGDSFTAALSGAASAVAPIITFLGNLLGALTPLAPVIAGIATAFIAWKVINSIVGAISSAITGLSGPLGVAALAVGALVLVYQSLNAKSAEITARTSEVTGALESQINALLETATQASAAALGMTALSKSLAETGEDGDKTAKALATLGLTVDDAADSLIKIGGETDASVTALEALARQAGLTADEAKFVAESVNSTDDSFTRFIELMKATGGIMGNVTPEMRAQAEAMGILDKGAAALDPSLVAVGDALEELQDQSAKTDIDKTIQDFLKLSAASSDTNAALLKQVGGTEALTKTGQPLLDVYNQYTKLLGENAAQSNEAAAAQDEVNAALAAGVDSTSSLTKGWADLEAAIKPAVDAVFGIKGPMTDAERAMEGVGQAADEAAKKADAFTEALDKLVSPKLDAAAALSDYEAAIDDLSKALEENGKTLDLGTEAGRSNAEQIRTNIESITAWGEAALANGQKQEDVTTMMNAMRQSLVEQVAAFTGSTESAEAYINTLGLTPDTIKTIVETPGLLQATADVLAYDLDLDGIDDRATVDTEFSTSNLPRIRQELTDYGVDLSNVPDEKLLQYLSENWTAVHDEAKTLQGDMQTITDNPATATVEAPTIPAVVDGIQQVADGMFGVDSQVATPTVSPEGIEQTKTDVAAVQTDMTDLDGKSAKPQVELMNNLVVLAVLGEIKKQVDALDKAKASPDVKIPNFGTVVAQTAIMTALLTQLGQQKPAPQVTLPTFPTVVGQVIVMNALLQQLNNQRASPSVTLANYGTVIGQILALGLAVAGLDRMSASVSVSTPGLSQAINDFRTLNNLITSTNGRVATVTTRNVTQNITQNLGGGMAGMMINGPQTLNVGERGLREALIPLDLPLSRVNPSVRGFAEMIRGVGVPAGGSIGRQVNVYNTIEVTSQSADPVAVATQVVNRAAAMAN